jgi:hypothetical protein
MLLTELPSMLVYLGFVVGVLFALPRFGRAVLAFLRDWDDYRANRPQR